MKTENILDFKIRSSAILLLFMIIGIIGMNKTFAQGNALKTNQNNHQDELQRRFTAWHNKVNAGNDSILLKSDDKTNELTFNDIMPAPEDPELWPIWRKSLKKVRNEMLDSLHYKNYYYDRKEFSWVSSSFVEHKVFMYDSTFIDPVTGEYKVEKYLENLQHKFGKVDNVILWQSYPRIGFDERNQFDLYLDMPGGLKGLREVVHEFHKEGIKVLICYNPWDGGTRFEESHVFPMVEILKSIEADGVYLDTWFEGEKLRTVLDSLVPGMVFETELALPINNVATHQMSWGQQKPWKKWLFKDTHAPGVVRNKWLEPRHVVHMTNRWEKDHSGELQTAWMNGTGILVWENDFGVINEWDERSSSILRSMSPIQRFFVNLFVEGEWSPLVEKSGNDVFASLWEQNGVKLWTLINRSDEAYRGNLLNVPFNKGIRYFDLVQGCEAQIKLKRGVVQINGTINSKGIGGFLAIPEEKVTNNFLNFLESQAKIYDRADWDTNFPEREDVLEHVSGTKKYLKDNLPEGMVTIDGGMVELKVKYKEDGRPTRFHDDKLKNRKLELSPYAIDLTPVTNSEYADFLKDSGYRPVNEKNFLKHWINGKPPAGKEDHPVVWIDLEDARAFARWAGKRLPTEEEWQYAAQGAKKLIWPWGNEMLNNICNRGLKGLGIDKLLEGTTSVYKYPAGRSPFGCYDMSGNTWEWTESLHTNGNSRFVFIKGGSYFQPTGGEGWYPYGGAQPTEVSEKYLLMYPGADRSPTIGFRCVVDIIAK